MKPHASPRISIFSRFNLRYDLIPCTQIYLHKPPAEQEFYQNQCHLEQASLKWQCPEIAQVMSLIMSKSLSKMYNVYYV